jgi:hypothetical protein
MTREDDVMQIPVSSRNYIRPQVLKMGDMRLGEGDCTTGSGNSEDCQENGMSANVICDEFGQGAHDTCVDYGSNAAKGCTSVGNSPS